MADEEVKLLSTWSSPFCLRVVWALKLKGIEYEYIEEDLTNKSTLLLQYNPVHKKVPVLVHNGKPVCESFVILEYLDHIWKQNRILPDHPHDKAMARFWANFGDDKLLHLFTMTAIKHDKEKEEAFEAVLECLKALEEEVKGKKFFGGEEIGLVDLSIGWLVNLGSLFEETADLKMLDENRFPSLVKWIDRFSKAPIIKDEWPPRDKLALRLHLALESLK
ncbi:hypothetical protein Syun_017894 [Stephania yunnanensis]|uniref:glutathione transferase n=1 Tax=Stephania yunnanensis TaxID=152371 RepID=A0AAP0P2V3_9MAGN